ncbi:MAG: dihydropteroate synthase [Candidatus Omnitrophica bacterium]|nr:dihydropteroate synthase [Candidatus Omnitrophota bacterium]
MKSRSLTAYPLRPHYLLKARHHTLKVGDKTLLMGVVNLTPDSFSDDGRLVKGHDPAANVRFAKQLIAQGADIIDLGAESSRPGAKTISVKEELDRLMPTLVKLARSVHVPISVDTYKPQVARQALEAGASIINNIRGTPINKPLLKMVRDYQAAIVLMHMRGNPRTMQKKASYKNLIKEVLQELRDSLEKCLEAGIKKDRIIIDPGLGFAKTGEHNLEILRDLYQFHVLGCPVLIGPSRKSFIGHILQKDTTQRLMGTSAAVSLGVAGGTHIVRVHDVSAMKDVVLVADAIIKEENQ